MENGSFTPLSYMMPQTCSQKTRHKDSSFIEIMSDEDKVKNPKEEAKPTSKKGQGPDSKGEALEQDSQDVSQSKTDLFPEEKDPKDVGDDPALEDPSHNCCPHCSLR